MPQIGFLIAVRTKAQKGFSSRSLKKHECVKKTGKVTGVFFIIASYYIFIHKMRCV